MNLDWGRRTAIRGDGNHRTLWSPAVKAGGWIFTSLHLAGDHEHGIAPEARIDERSPYLQDPMELQCRRLLKKLGRTLDSAGCDIRRDVIRVWQWMPAEYPTDEEFAQGPHHWPKPLSIAPYVDAVREVGFGSDTLRSSTGILVRQLPVPKAMFGVEAIAMEPRAGLSKQGFPAPPDLPQPRAYSPATRFGDWVFLAGFGATDMRGDFMSEKHMGEPSGIAPEARPNPFTWFGSEIEQQTEFTLSALSRIAEAAGTSLDRCVKADVTIGHPNDFWGFDRVWRRWFSDNPPARTVLPGARLVIKGLRVEIAMVLLAEDSDLRIQRIDTPDASNPLGHAPQGVTAGPFLFLSGRLPVDGTGCVPDELCFDPELPYFRQPAKAQMRALLKDVEALCAAAGTSLSNVCKVQLTFDDLIRVAPAMDEWRAAFPTDPPALGLLGVWGRPLLVPGAHMLLDAIAFVPGRGD